MTNQESGERIVIINDSSPDYSLIRITEGDLEVHGKINPHFSKDILLPNYSLPTKIRVVCQEPFGEGVFISVGRVSPFREPGFFINETELESPKELNSKITSLFIPLDPKAGYLRLEMHCKKDPIGGLLWCETEFRFPTERY